MVELASDWPMFSIDLLPYEDELIYRKISRSFPFDDIVSRPARRIHRVFIFPEKCLEISRKVHSYIVPERLDEDPMLTLVGLDGRINLEGRIIVDCARWRVETSVKGILGSLRDSYTPKPKASSATAIAANPAGGQLVDYPPHHMSATVPTPPQSTQKTLPSSFPVKFWPSQENTASHRPKLPVPRTGRSFEMHPGTLVDAQSPEGSSSGKSNGFESRPSSENITYSCRTTERLSSEEEEVLTGGDGCLPWSKIFGWPPLAAARQWFKERMRPSATAFRNRRWLVKTAHDQTKANVRRSLFGCPGINGSIPDTNRSNSRDGIDASETFSSERVTALDMIFSSQMD